MKTGLITKIKKMFTLITIRGLNINQHNVNEYILIFIYLLKNKNMTFIIREIHIIDNLNVKTLIEIDIMKSKCIMLNLQRDIITINFY